MIELRKNKMWYDGLDTMPEVDRPWDCVARGLHKFICWGPGDAGAEGGGDTSTESKTTISTTVESQDFGVPAPGPSPTGPEDISSDEDIDPDDPPAPSIGFGDPTGPLGGGPKGQSDDTGPISESEEEAFDTEAAKSTGSFEGFAGSFFGSQEKDESIEDLDPGEFPGEQGPFGRGGLGTALGFGALSPPPPPPPLPPPPQFLAPPPPPPKPLAPIEKEVIVQPRPIMDVEERQKGEELDAGLFNPLGNVEDQDDDLFNALATDKGLQEFEATDKAAKARGAPEPGMDTSLFSSDIGMFDTDIDDFEFTEGLPSLLGLGISKAFALAGLGPIGLATLGVKGAKMASDALFGKDSFISGLLGKADRIADVPENVLTALTEKASDALFGKDTAQTITTAVTESPLSGTVSISPQTGSGVVTGNVFGSPVVSFGLGSELGAQTLSIADIDAGVVGEETGDEDITGEKYGGQIGKKSGGLVSLRKAYNGGNISGLASTGTNIIDTINRGLAMPSNIGAVQMQEKLEVNPNNPYTNR